MWKSHGIMGNQDQQFQQLLATYKSHTQQTQPQTQPLSIQQPHPQASFNTSSTIPSPIQYQQIPPRSYVSPPLTSYQPTTHHVTPTSTYLPSSNVNQYLYQSIPQEHITQPNPTTHHITPTSTYPPSSNVNQYLYQSLPQEHLTQPNPTTHHVTPTSTYPTSSNANQYLYQSLHQEHLTQ